MCRRSYLQAAARTAHGELSTNALDMFIYHRNAEMFGHQVRGVVATLDLVRIKFAVVCLLLNPQHPHFNMSQFAIPLPINDSYRGSAVYKNVSCDFVPTLSKHLYQAQKFCADLTAATSSVSPELRVTFFWVEAQLFR